MSSACLLARLPLANKRIFSQSPRVALPQSCCAVVTWSFWSTRRGVTRLLRCIACYPVCQWGSLGLGVLLSSREIQALSVFQANLRVLIVLAKWHVINQAFQVEYCNLSETLGGLQSDWHHVSIYVMLCCHGVNREIVFICEPKSELAAYQILVIFRQIMLKSQIFFPREKAKATHRLFASAKNISPSGFNWVQEVCCGVHFLETNFITNLSISRKL